MSTHSFSRYTKSASLAVFLISALFTMGTAQASWRGSTVADVTEYTGFETLNFALNATGLLGALDGRTRVTLLAPTNEAFDKLLTDLGCSDLDQLVDELGVANLEEVLKDHVVEGRRSKQSLVRQGVVPLLSGRSANAGIGERGAYVAGAVNEVALRKPFVTESLWARNGYVLPVNEVIVNIDPTGICGFGT